MFNTNAKRAGNGMTLVELLAVVAILAILAGMIVPYANRYTTYSKLKASKASIVQLRSAIIGTPEKPGYADDIGNVPNNLNDLFVLPAGVSNFDRDTTRGWRGPYMLGGTSMTASLYSIRDSSFKGGSPNDFIINTDQVVLDAWGNPFVIQRVALIGNVIYFNKRDGSRISLGTTSGMTDGDYSRLISAGPDGKLQTQASDYGGAVRGDDIVLFLNHADPNPPVVSGSNPGSDPDLPPGS